jgi:hypothetical protein
MRVGVPLADDREWFDVPGDVLRNYAGIHTKKWRRVENKKGCGSYSKEGAYLSSQL